MKSRRALRHQWGIPDVIDNQPLVLADDFDWELDHTTVEVQWQLRSGGTTTGYVCAHDRWITGWDWRADFIRGAPTLYLRRNETISGRARTIMAHRQLKGIWFDDPRPRVVDHYNSNGLDNRCWNIRVCTYSENRRNTRGLQINNQSGTTGVDWYRGSWRARIMVPGGKRKLLYVGPDLALARQARLEAESLFFGTFAPRRRF